MQLLVLPIIVVHVLTARTVQQTQVYLHPTIALKDSIVQKEVHGPNLVLLGGLLILLQPASVRFAHLVISVYR